MGQVSDYLRRGEGRYFHWCPGCEELHQLPDSWTFDGNLVAPTFNPSFLQTGNAVVYDEHGRWTGEWHRDAQGQPIPRRCHYHLHSGVLKFCQDSDHALAGKEVPLPPLPAYHRDDYQP